LQVDHHASLIQATQTTNPATAGFVVTAKLRCVRDKHVTRISVALEVDHTHKHDRRTAFPWMQITDAMLERAGFLPGQQVLFSVDHRCGHITITPDYDYRIAGRYMTVPEAEATRQRLSRRK
jgi:hypothetical protein